MPIDHPYLLAIQAEHGLILRTLADLMKREDLVSGFFAYCANYVDRSYFERIERFLFQAIHDKSGIQAGGPMCMLYFDQHLNHRSLDIAAKFTQRRRFQPDSTNVPAHLREFYQNNSPVCIPTEDHFACREIVAKAQELLAAAPNETNSRELVFLSNVYFDILKLNFEKKNNCLLPMSQTLLAPDELTTWAARAAQWTAENLNLK